MRICDKLHYLTPTFVWFLPQRNNVMQKWHAKMRWPVLWSHDNNFILSSDVEGSTCLKCPQFGVPFPWRMLLLGQQQWWWCCQAVSFRQRHTSTYILIYFFMFSTSNNYEAQHFKSSHLKIHCHLLIVITALEHDDIPHNTFQHFVHVLFLFSPHFRSCAIDIAKKFRSKLSCMLHTSRISCDWDITPSI